MSALCLANTHQSGLAVYIYRLRLCYCEHKKQKQTKYMNRSYILFLHMLIYVNWNYVKLHVGNSYMSIPGKSPTGLYST